MPAILDVIASGEVSLVVNTPSPRSGPVRDAAAIRLAAVAGGHPVPDEHGHGHRRGAFARRRTSRARSRDVRPLDVWLAVETPAAV